MKKKIRAWESFKRVQVLSVKSVQSILFFKWKSEQPNELFFKQWLPDWRGKKIKVKSTWERDQDSRRVGSRVHLLLQKHWKCYWNASTSGMIHTELQTEHWQRTLDFQKEKKPSHNQGGKRKKRIRIRPVLLGGNCEGRDIPAPWEGSSPVGRSTWKEGELQGLSKRREHQTVKNNLHRRLTPPHCDPNLRYSSVSGGGGWVLKCRLQSSGPGKGPEISMETTRRGQLWQLRVYYEVWACQRGKLPLLGDT